MRSTRATRLDTASSTYQTAYLKAHYPVEYFVCLLTSVKSNLDKAAVYLSDCRLALKVLTPDMPVRS